MNEFVELAGAPAATANSLIFTGLTLRTLMAARSSWRVPAFAAATRSPFQRSGPEVIANVAVTLDPGATEAKEDAARATDFQPGGTVTLSARPATAVVPEF